MFRCRSFRSSQQKTTVKYATYSTNEREIEKSDRLRLTDTLKTNLKNSQFSAVHYVLCRVHLFTVTILSVQSLGVCMWSAFSLLHFIFGSFMCGEMDLTAWLFCNLSYIFHFGIFSFVGIFVHFVNKSIICASHWLRIYECVVYD